MNKRQRKLVDSVNERHEGRISTHYDDCWMYHAGCLAWYLISLEGDDE